MRRPTETSGRKPESALRDATLCVSFCELNNRHGTGVLLNQIFAREPAFAVIYSFPVYGDECSGDMSLRIWHETSNPDEALAPIAAALEGHEVTRILCAPQLTSDVLSATAAAALTGAPLVAYVIDDSNVFRGGISDAAMRLLVDRSAICFAISPLLCDVYGQKFREPFWLLPPVNERRLFAPPDLEPPANREPRGVIIGNVWSSEVIADLRSTIRLSGLRVDWYGNAGRPVIDLDPADLARDGIAWHPNLAHEALVRELRRCDYAIMPSRVLGEKRPQDFYYRASLPSKLVFLATTAHVPIVVLGGTNTPAAEFVTSFGLGVVSPYEPEQFAEAVRKTTTSPERDAIRARAAALSPNFVAEGVSDWIWRSAAIGRPVDARYEHLFARPFSRPVGSSPG